MTPLKDICDALHGDDGFLFGCAKMEASSPRSRHSPQSRPRSSSSNSSRPRAFVISGKTINHGSRRLFDADEGDDLEEGGNYEKFDLSPPRTMQRPMLRPLNLNSELHDFDYMDAGEDRSSAIPTPIPMCRKRPAANGRSEPTSSEPSSFALPGNTSMQFSPHISPNSFLTMDGRFVQSKNPFSSPMLTDDDHGKLAAQTTSSATATAPTMPVMFQSEISGFGASSCTLAPRNHHRCANLRHPSVESAVSTVVRGYPDKFCFTGSPIQEDEVMEEASLSTASSASLAKVRRFNITDDIVAASGQELSTYKKILTIDTGVQAAPSAMSHDPSPTDILSFPTPPTPVKVKRHSKANDTYYSTIRLQEPTTPSLERRGKVVGHVDATTPHPGRSSLLQRETRHISQFTVVNSSSRFTNDFDVIGELGKGSFGCVYKVLSRLDGCMYAIKAAKRQAKGSSDRDRMLKEVGALKCS